MEISILTVVQPPVFGPPFKLVSGYALWRGVGETSGGVMRSGRQITLITPKRLSRFGIEVDEALRVGRSGFLGESDAGASSSCISIRPV